MAISELIIRISGENEDLKDKLDEISAKTEALQDTLKGISTAGTIGFAAFTGAILGSVAAYAEADASARQQTAVLNSTGFAAGLTARNLEEMAKALSETTTFGDDMVRTGQNMLLTFTNINKDAFEPALKGAMDLSAAFGGDLASNAQLVGKALNDPAIGLAALTRAGVQFTEEQKKSILSMQEFGNLAGAQGAILDVLATKVGGSAAAAAQGTGSFTLLKNSFGQVIEGVGKQLSPALETAATALTTFFNKLKENESALRSIAAFLVTGAGWSALIAGAAGAALAFIKLNNVIDTFKPKVTGMTSSVYEFNLALVQSAGTAIKSFITALFQATFGGNGFIANMKSAGSAVLSFATQAVVAAIAGVKSLAASLRNGSTSAVSFFSNFGSNVIGLFKGLGGAFSFAGTGARIMSAGMKVAAIGARLLAGAMTLGIGLILPIIIGLIQDFVTDGIANFNRATKEITAAFKRLGDNLLAIGSGIGTFLKGLFTFNFAEVKKGAEQIKSAVTKAVDDAFKDVDIVKQKIAVEKVKEEKAAAGDTGEDPETEKALKGAAARKAIRSKETADTVAEAQRKKELTAEEAALQQEIATMYANKTSLEVIKIKEEELKLLGEVKNAGTAAEVARSEAELERFRAESGEKIQAVLAAEIEKREAKKELEAEFAELDAADRELATTTQLESLTADELRRREVLRASAEEEANLKRQSQAQFVKDQIKYGQTYATINKFMNSEAVKGTADATQQLVQLQQSRNSTLAGIGKAAALIQIGIDTAKSAMSIYSGFATIPIIGPALGVAGAAAAIAFGAEKMSRVRSAQMGGVVPGSGSGDIVPAMLEPGEIIVPKALSPTFKEQFGGVTPDENSPVRRSEVNIGTIIGTEEFVKSNIIPALRDANQLDNANIGVG
jgi:hypothetical protein